MTKAKIIFAAVTLAAGALIANAASADIASPANHSRRAEINARLAHENLRIGEALQAGLISPRRAHALHREVHSIRLQEQAFAIAQNGHVTRHQQRLLNREENVVSGQIVR